MPADDAIALLRALLADPDFPEPLARRHVAAAAKLHADLLDYAAGRFQLPPMRVWQRAASWAGYEFAYSVPPPPPLPPIAHLDRLGEMRSVTLHSADGDVVYLAPRAEQIVSLRRAARPDLVERIRFVPPDAIETALAHAASEQLMDNARQRIAQLWPDVSASQGLTLAARISFVVTLALLIVLVMLAGLIWRPVLVPLVALILIAPGVLRLIAAFPVAEPIEPPPLPDALLPSYTILIPLRDEAQMVPLLRQAMSALDYPSHLLDIKFVVESKSPETVRAVEGILGDPRFRLIIVPERPPNTKPKALNYALPLARGELLVVYDAEDVPAPEQLRLAAARFHADPDLACLQAELVPENAHENALTTLFAGEYAGLFNRLLPAISRWGLAMPLGGTSNHFRTAMLRDIGGWDSFNVTEDADLGVRLARRGLRAEPFVSRTYEEAPVSLTAWLAQRTRWMKGWMQTYAVHNRAPLRFLRDIGWRGFLGFQILVGGMILSSLLHTVFLGALLGGLINEGIVGLIPSDIWDWFSAVILFTGYGGAIAVVVSGLAHWRAFHLIPAQLLLPVYWMLHSIAAVLAAWELIVKPVHWAKTEHGRTRVGRATDEEIEPGE